MSVVAGSIKWVIAGILPGGEFWNTGFWTTPDSAPATPEDLILQSAPVQVACNDFLALWKANWSAGTQARTLTGYWYPGGEFGDNAEFSAEVPLDANGGTASNPAMPDQVAWVASLRTGISGRRFRGRMYLPHNVGGLTPSGQRDDTPTATAATQVADFLSAVNAGGQTVIVMSSAGVLATPVTSVVVDSRLDIQRRRANQQAPQFSHNELLS